MSLLPVLNEKEYFERRAYVKEQLLRLYVPRMFAKELKRLASVNEDTLVKRNRTRVLRHGEHLLYTLGQARRQFYGSRQRQKLLEGRFAAMKPLADVYEAAGQPLVLVGGALRDYYMDVAISRDFDFTSTASVDTNEALLKQAGYNVYNVGNSRGFGVIFGVHPETKNEVQVLTVLHFERDLETRDFSVNSMGMDMHGTFVGQRHYECVKDARKRILRPLGPIETMISSDPIRILRAFRLAFKLKAQIDPKLLSSIACNAYKVREASPERLAAELIKMLEMKPCWSTLRDLFQSGVLSNIAPWVNFQLGQKYPLEAYQVSTWEMTLGLVDQMEKNGASWKTKLAGLMSNMLATGEETWTAEQDHAALEFLKNVLKLGKDDVLFVMKMLRAQHRWDLKTKPTTAQVREFLYEMGNDDQFKATINLLKTRASFKTKEHNNFTIITGLRQAIDLVKDKEAVYRPKPLMGAEEVMAQTGIVPGPLLGRVMNKLKMMAVRGQTEVNLEELKGET